MPPSSCAGTCETTPSESADSSMTTCTSLMRVCLLSPIPKITAPAPCNGWQNMCTRTLHNSSAGFPITLGSFTALPTVSCMPLVSLAPVGSISENMAKVAAQRESLQVLFSHTMDSLSAQGTVQPIIEAVLAAEQAEVRCCCAVLAAQKHLSCEELAAPGAAPCGHRSTCSCTMWHHASG